MKIFWTVEEVGGGGGRGVEAGENSSGRLHGWMHGLFTRGISAGEPRGRSEG